MDNLLSDDERAKIRAEEILRREVRESLEGAGSRWWSFLNSAFGLWLLGSVSVGVITWSFGAIRDRQREETESRVLSRRLRTEIAARVDAATYVFRSSEFHEPRPEVDDYGEAANVLNGQAGNATYPEFTGRKLSSLVIQLRDNGSCIKDLEPSITEAQLLEADFNKMAQANDRRVGAGRAGLQLRAQIARQEVRLSARDDQFAGGECVQMSGERRTRIVQRGIRH
jgi:hypothetical protein